ncbi:hypothetical protein [Ulvibacter litoralis]|uniref:Tellurite resistance protein TerB n=1 Tax=Ulvibacter litoralis TaxID=227084 RepID=A0A1G7I942_9FLAO|nr:hypothetical protein [Ulvibacter litoralis]GHC62087.1 hypothetical protein GCM10008083_28970 [Ulvibacter litoralis]SDF09287.1 hypothetical protein SAMN05421855_105158 [Ulvibacter litoralis]
MSTVSPPELLFYQKLGELFYAVAAADKVVREAEYKMLTTLVEDEWKQMDDYKDQFKTDAAYQISIVFEWFDYERMDADDCFESFTNYYKNHQNLFSEERKALILKTVQKIADAFNGINKSELIMLTKLGLLFKKN